MDTKAQNPYDEEMSKKYNSDSRFDHPHQFMAYSTWLEEIGDVRNKRVLDLACGSGASSRMLAEKGAIVTGVDISKAMLDEAIRVEGQSPRGITYIQSDASIPKPYNNEPFDIVVAAFFLHYADNLEVLRGFLENIALNLKKGGKFVTINMSPEHPIVEPGKNISHSSLWLDRPFENGSRLEVKLWSVGGEEIVTLNDYHWSKDTYENEMIRVGLTEIEWVEPRMHEGGKKLYNWQEIQKKNMLVIIKANKST